MQSKPKEFSIELNVFNNAIKDPSLTKKYFNVWRNAQENAGMEIKLKFTIEEVKGLKYIVQSKEHGHDIIELLNLVGLNFQRNKTENAISIISDKTEFFYLTSPHKENKRYHTERDLEAIEEEKKLEEQENYYEAAWTSFKIGH